MAEFSVTAISSDAEVNCHSFASKVLNRMKAHASTTANSPNSSARSSAKAINRSPSLAKRYRLAARAGADGGAAVVVTAGAGCVSPSSSKRYWPEGIAPPQRLHCFACELTWPWQCGHSIILRRPSPSVLQSIRDHGRGLGSPKVNGQAAIVLLESAS